MNTTRDNVVYADTKNGDISKEASRPFLEKQIVYQIDDNGGPNYSRNQITFNTTNFSNNGKWCDYKNAWISIPTVTTVESDVPLTAVSGPEAIQYKGSNLNIIDSIVIDYGNNNVIQMNKNINPYLIFKQHNVLSLNDVELNGRTTGYKRHGYNWRFSPEAGMMNNDPDENEVLQNQSCTMYDPEEQMVLPMEKVVESGDDFMENHPGGKVRVYYHDVILRLKDLPFFENMPMVKGATIRITINLNQCSASYTVAGNTITNIHDVTLSGSTMPILRVDCLNEVDRTETITMKVVQNYNATTGLTHTHVKKNTRLYLPVYTMEAGAESRYLEIGQRKMIYDDVFVTHIRNLEGGKSFQNLLTNSMARLQKLVIVPMLSRSSNGTLGKWSPQESPLASEPSTCSPCFIRNFNVQLSGTNIYRNDVQYKYQHFLDEQNGMNGTNSNTQDGLVSGLIDLKRYCNNFGYIVVDLSRRYLHESNVPQSVQIQGHIASPLALDFLCFLVFHKDVTFDLVTGKMVD